MDDAPGPLPPDLRFLKRLVTVLTATMIVGLLAIVALLVTRLGQDRDAGLIVPDRITLPDGVRVEAFTQGADWFAVVTGDDRILIYGSDGALRQTVEITR